MTPTPRRQKEQGTPDTAAESPEPPLPPPMDIPQLYRLLDTQIRVNIGTSVKCGICLSTLQSPTRTPCGHAFCKPCILASLRSIAKCPECNTKITKRALQPAHEQLQKLATLYKQSLVEFGFAPGVYQAGFTTLTQKPPSDPDDSDDDSDNDQPGTEKGRSESDNEKKQLALDRLHVAATWQHQAVPTTKIQRDENAMVVQANTKACETVGWVVGQPPTTQDILDQAREQQVADTALEDSIHDWSSPSRSTGRRVCFETVITPRTKRPIPKSSSTTGSPFLASSLSPIAQEGSQRSETEPMEACKPSPAAVGVDPPAGTRVAWSLSPPMPQQTEPATKVAAISEPSHVVDPTRRSTESKSDDKESTSTSGSFGSIESKSQAKEATVASESFESIEYELVGKEATAASESLRNIESKLEDKEPTSTSGTVGSMESKSERKEPTSKSVSFISTGSPTEKTHSPKAAEVSGVVEDSFGALHWTNKSNITLTLSPLDQPEDSTLSLTFPHEEPARDHRNQQREKSQEKKESEHTKLDSSNLAEDSDTTVPMSTDTINDLMEQEDDEKPTAATTKSRRRANSEPSFAVTVAFAVGDIVNVQSRTWSGINKPGGVARITSINPDHTYNVAYVLGGREANVDAVFVTATDNTDKRRRRETTLPVSLLQALEAQGFDTTGQRTLEVAPMVPKKEKEDSSSRKQSRKEALQHLSDQPSDSTGKRRRRETTLPVSLLQALKAQGFDTTGQQPPALLVPKKEKEDSSNRKHNRKDALQDLSNHPMDSKTKYADTKQPAKKTKRSASCSRNSTANEAKEVLSGDKPTKKRNRPTVNQANKVTDGSGDKKQSSKRNKTGQDASDTLIKAQAMCTEESTISKTPQGRQHNRDASAGDTHSTEKCPRMSAAVSVLESLSGVGTVPDDDVCKLADAYYQARFEASLQEKVMHVVASGLSEVDMDTLKSLTSRSLANDVRIKLGDRISKKTALCITPLDVDVSTGDSTTLLRTVKVMRASLAGIPIVSPTWLYDCQQEGMSVSLCPQFRARSLPSKADPSSFSGDSKLGIARMAALLAQKAPLPLQNHFIFFCGAFEGNHRKDLQLLAREAGAKVLTNASAVTKKLGKAKVTLVCHDVPPTGTMIPPSLLDAVRTSLTSHSTTTMVVNSQWIFESVTCAKVLPSAAFAPVNIKAREL